MTFLAMRDLPEEQRPREKLLARGAEALSDAELLAIFLGSGHSGRTESPGNRAGSREL